MKLKTIKIGNLHTKNNVFLAPLAGYTNAPFRKLCYNNGAGLTFTEMVSAKGLCHKSEKTESLLIISQDYTGIPACQIFGNEPETMREACQSQALAPFPLIDINMGCPMPKIYKNGEGSALLQDLKLAGKIISECKKSGKLISVKFRIGIDENSIVAAEFAKMCEGAGADIITVHGRTRDKIYAGEVNFREIAAAKNSVKIPVIANGGVFSKADAENLLNQTGADGIAVARGALYNPWLFSEITSFSSPALGGGIKGGGAISALPLPPPLAGEVPHSGGGGEPVNQPFRPDKKSDVKIQLYETRELFGERFACVFMRKMISFYLKGQKNSSALRLRLMRCASTAEIEEILNGLNF